MEPTRTFEPDSPRSALEIDSDFVADIVALIGEGEERMVANILADLHPADIAQIITHVPFRDAQRLFGWLDKDAAGGVLSELDDDFRADLLEEVPRERITEVLDELPSDDAADILADLPESVAQEVLPELEDAAEINALLAYEEDTAGGLMAREFVAVGPDWTVAQATEEVRRKAEDVGDVFVLFAVDSAYRLLGFVPLKRLLLARADARIESILDPDVVSVPTDTDQEEVARIMERYDLVSMPVVDASMQLVGRVTIDDVVDVIREEAEEDIQRMSGVAGGEEPTDSVLRVTRGRLPWLLLGLAGSGLAALVIAQFEDALRTATVLASFIPVVMATAGNAGIQSSAIAVQGLASGEIWVTDIMKRLGKEIAVALLNGIASALFMGVAILGVNALFPEAVPDPSRLIWTAGLALIAVIVLATTIGATVPILLNRVGIDPALATGPFITTSNDVIGIVVFFLLAEALYL